MKKLSLNKYVALFSFCLFLLPAPKLAAQDDTVAKEEVVKMHYYNSNNKMQYLLVESLLKAGRKTEPQKNRALQVFLDSNQGENLIAKFVTDESGKAKIGIPSSLKSVWEASPRHTFIAVAPASGKEEEKTYTLEVVKARITLDTASDEEARNITVKVEQYVNDEWVPAADVEMKVGVERLGGILSAGDEATYTTDSTGVATIEFTRDSLPGDQHGAFTLVARTEDNELFGNLIAEKKVPWGKPTVTGKDFFAQRTLWTIRSRTPFWLLFMAYSIILGVWGTLIYLVFQLVKIKKLGKGIAPDSP